jgi:hypothetical protein
MKASPSNSLWDLKALAIVGVGVFILMFSLPVVLGYVVLLHSATLSGLGNDSSIVLRDDEPLGEKGSRCGGTTHLPCRPGLSCSATKSGEIGTCMEASGTVVNVPQLNGACQTSDDLSCAPGLVCNVEEGAAGTCIASNETSPHIVSVRLDGLHPQEGAYVAEVGEKGTAVIQTLNAKTLVVKIKVGEKAEIVNAIESDGGNWSAPFTMPSASADMIVTAVGEDGKDRSSLMLRIAPSGELR